MSRFTTLLAFVLSFTFLVSAQTPQLPTCASACVISSSDLPSGCSQTDFSCICKDQAYISKLGCCAVAACSASDLPAVSAFAQNLCQSVGVTVDTTPPTNCPGSAGAANGTTNSTSTTPSGSTTSASPSATAKSLAASNFTNNLAPFFTAIGALVAGYLLL